MSRHSASSAACRRSTARRCSRDTIAHSQPTSAEEAKTRGNFHFKQGDFEAAIQLYRESLSLLEEGGEALDLDQQRELRSTLLVNTAECQRQLGDYESVIALCTKAISAAPEMAKKRRSPQTLKAYLRRGLALEKLEKFSDAKTDFRVALELDPTNHIASAALVRCAKSSQVRATSSDL